MARAQKTTGKQSHKWAKGVLAGTIFVLASLYCGYLLLKDRLSGPVEAPEAELILSAQAMLPFQVLIPAYLPGGFDREKIEIQTDRTSPQGERMVRLIYSTRAGIQLVLEEWIPKEPEAYSPIDRAYRDASAGTMPCNCFCNDQGECSISRLMLEVGPLRVSAETSDPYVLDRNLMGTILRTLAPASGLQILTSLEEIPLSSGLPPAVEIPVGNDSVQEIVLVVSQEGYNPVHFAVSKDIPVRLIFKQLGQVGCGNELFIEWGPGQQGHLITAFSGDSQVLEFTPQQAGEFPFNCPHYIYRGVMTVQE